MAFDNVYPNRKDWRKDYYNSRRFDWGCRNHGSCGWCEGNRTHKHLRRRPVEEKYETSVGTIII